MCGGEEEEKTDMTKKQLNKQMNKDLVFEIFANQAIQVILT